MVPRDTRYVLRQSRKARWQFALFAAWLLFITLPMLLGLFLLPTSSSLGAWLQSSKLPMIATPLGFLLLVPFGITAERVLKERREEGCRTCGYPLHGLSNPTRCPECGTIDPHDLAPFPSPRRCFDCRHDLYGLDDHTHCPECGGRIRVLAAPDSA